MSGPTIGEALRATLKAIGPYDLEIVAKSLDRDEVVFLRWKIDSPIYGKRAGITTVRLEVAFPTDKSPPPPNPSPVSEEKPEHEQHHQQAPNPARAITPATGPRDGGGDEHGEDNQEDEESEQGSTSLSGGNVVTDGEDA